MRQAPLDEIRWGTPPALVGLSAWAGGVLGFATNAVNARVSPAYFEAVMHWPSEDLQAFAVIQGMFEGGALGLVFGVVLAIVGAASSKLRCPLRLAAPIVLRTVLLALACWAAGGAAGVAVAATGGGWVEVVLPGIPPDRGDALRHAWVGGSTWGAYAAAGIGALYGAVSLHRRWHRHWAETTPAFPVLPLLPPVH